MECSLNSTILLVEGKNALMNIRSGPPGSKTVHHHLACRNGLVLKYIIRSTSFKEIWHNTSILIWLDLYS